MSTIVTEAGPSLSQLEQIKKFSTIGADTADFENIRESNRRMPQGGASQREEGRT